MIAQNTTKWLATIMLFTTCATMAHGQNAFGPFYSPFGNGGADTDAEWFSPVELDFDNNPYRKSSGYFFRFDKLNWAAKGRQTTIGDPNVVVLSEEIYYVGDPDFSAVIGLDLETPVPQYVIENGLKDVVPDFSFGLGDRYEFGHHENGNGWMIGILDGPDMADSATYGSGPQPSGFGSIHINFVTPPDYLRGFRDYTSNADDSEGTVTNGPGGPGSGTPDDLNGNLVEAVNTLSIGDTVVAIITDFADSSLFNVRFNQLNVHNSTEVTGIELMRTIQLSNRHKMQKHQGRRAEIGYGVRLLRIDDEFGFDGTSDLFTGLNRINMVSDNHIIGPQLRGKWTTQHGRWNLALDGRLVLGYNYQDLQQSGTWAEGMTTGAPNALEVGQPTTFTLGRQENVFSPLAELRVDSTYQLTSSIAMRLGYTAMFVDNISRSAQLIQYRLPDWGIGASGKQDIFFHGANLGIDITY